MAHQDLQGHVVIVEKQDLRDPMGQLDHQVPVGQEDLRDPPDPQVLMEKQALPAAQVLVVTQGLSDPRGWKASKDQLAHQDQEVLLDLQDL